MLDEFVHEPRVAYFSMEIALRSEIPTYSGGLGILAGDTLRSAADIGLPMVAVSLVARAGYFRQTLDAEGRQIEQPASWDPASWARLLSAKVAVSIEGRMVWVGAWLYIVEGQAGTRQPVVLLDTDLYDNAPADREITNMLYGGDEIYRLKQEVVLGIGGVRMLRALGFRVRQYHLNEGHSALLTLELMRRYAYAPHEIRPGESLYDIPRVRELCNFTTHTPVEAGHDQFSYEIVQRILRDVVNAEASQQGPAAMNPDAPARGADERQIDLMTLKRLGGEDRLNMTRLALNLSEYINGVAVRHAEVSRRLFPEYRVHAITNGVHPFTWTCESFCAFYDKYVPAWRHEPEQLVRVDCCVPDEAILEAHDLAKQMLIRKIQVLTGVSLRADQPILGFARRMTAYKRPDLLFHEVERLAAMAQRYPFQILLAGKAHPRDAAGKRLIEELHAHARALAGRITTVYAADYDMALAQAMVAGVDVWLNTPLPPLEASGTSGMKAAFNGVPSLSVLDGWWVEGCIEGITGWAIEANRDDTASAAGALYDKLERVVLPLFSEAEKRPARLRVMKGAISKNASYFNSHRMMRRYATEAYLR